MSFTKERGPDNLAIKTGAGACQRGCVEGWMPTWPVKKKQGAELGTCLGLPSLYPNCDHCDQHVELMKRVQILCVK